MKEEVEKKLRDQQEEGKEEEGKISLLDEAAQESTAVLP